MITEASKLLPVLLSLPLLSDLRNSAPLYAFCLLPQLILDLYCLLNAVHVPQPSTDQNTDPIKINEENTVF